jgi:hypothetical protein
MGMYFRIPVEGYHAHMDKFYRLGVPQHHTCALQSPFETPPWIYSIARIISENSWKFRIFRFIFQIFLLKRKFGDTSQGKVEEYHLLKNF